MADPQQPIGYDAQGNPIRRVGYDKNGNPITEKVAEGSGAISRFASGAWENLNPVTAVQGIYQAVRHPLDTASAIKQNTQAEWAKAGQAYEAGNLDEAANRAVAAIPLVGPMIDQVGTKLREGDYAGAVGNVIGLAVPGAVAKAAPRALRFAPLRSRNPNVAKAMDLAMAEGVPVGTATASGHAGLNRVNYGVTAGSLAGFKDFETPVAKGFQKLSDKILQEVRPGAGTTPEASGSKLASSMRRVMETHANNADAAYTRVREIAEQHIEPRPVWRMVEEVDPKTGATAMVRKQVDVDMAAPVDLRQAKAELQPIYEDLLADPKWTDVQKASNPGFNAIKQIVAGDDYAPLDRVLKLESAIGKMQRGSGATGIRQTGERLAAHTYGKLKSAIDDAVSGLGPDAAETQSQLAKGAAATKKKWAVDQELGQLGQGKKGFSEGMDAYRKLIEPHDNNINQLQRAALRAPAEMTNVGRAMLEQWFTEAFGQGGLESTKRMLSDWRKLGPKTKAVLFPDPIVRQRVNDTLLAMKTWADSPNPSGTGAINAAMHMVYKTMPTGVVGAQLGLGPAVAYQTGMTATSLALNSPKLAKLLVRGLMVPTGPLAKAGAATQASGITLSEAMSQKK